MIFDTIFPKKDTFSETLTVTTSQTGFGSTVSARSFTMATPIIEQISGTVTPALTLQGSFDRSEWHTIHTVTATPTTSIGVTVPTTYTIDEMYLRLKIDNSANTGSAVVQHNLICGVN
jgi:hypothetical protein